MEKKHVLIIDDERDIAMLFSVVLGMVGFNCETIHTVADAVKRLEEVVPDIILLDMRLGMDTEGGEDILYQIRSNPRFSETQVIVITAYPQMATQVTSLADLIMLKPVDINQLKILASRIGSTERDTTEAHFFDALTGLYNEVFFKNRLEHAFERGKHVPGFIYAVSILRMRPDLDRPEDISTEDLNALLSQVAARLRLNLRPTDTISRLDSGLFATLHEDLTNHRDAVIISKRIRDFLEPLYKVSSRTYGFRFTLGMALNNAGHQNAEDILRAAVEDLS